MGLQCIQSGAALVNLNERTFWTLLRVSELHRSYKDYKTRLVVSTRGS